MSTADGDSLLPSSVVSADEAARAVAGEIATAIRQPSRVDGSTVLGLATGRTPIGVYRELARMHREESLDFGRVVTFNLDEYLGLGADHPGSFRHFMGEHLFRDINLAPERVHFLDGLVGAAEIETHCRDYEAAIVAAGGIDLQLLGLGRNGHIGFNEPGSSRVSRTRAVTLDEGTRADNGREFVDDADVPRRALTIGVATILEARRLCVLAFGDGKRDVVARTLGNAVSSETPATFLRLHPNARLWIDEAAAGA